MPGAGFPPLRASVQEVEQRSQDFLALQFLGDPQMEAGLLAREPLENVRAETFADGRQVRTVVAMKLDAAIMPVASVLLERDREFLLGRDRIVTIGSQDEHWRP